MFFKIPLKVHEYFAICHGYVENPVLMLLMYLERKVIFITKAKFAF